MVAAHPSRKDGQPYSAAPYMGWTSNLIEAQHEEALYAFGELCLFTLMWRPVDFEKGLVAHCSTCFAGESARQAAAFNQPTRKECPDCFGTTFEGGFRAQIIRPTILADRNSEMSDEARGVVVSDTLLFETTADFTLHKGDYLFRFDNTRFQCEEKGQGVVRTGFAPPYGIDSYSGSSTARMEEPTSVAFLIPPLDPVALQTVLGLSGPFTISQITNLDTLSPNGYI